MHFAPVPALVGKHGHGTIEGRSNNSLNLTTTVVQPPQTSSSQPLKISASEQLKQLGQNMKIAPVPALIESKPLQIATVKSIATISGNLKTITSSKPIGIEGKTELAAAEKKALTGKAGVFKQKLLEGNAEAMRKFLGQSKEQQKEQLKRLPPSERNQIISNKVKFEQIEKARNSVVNTLPPAVNNSSVVAMEIDTPEGPVLTITPPPVTNQPITSLIVGMEGIEKSKESQTNPYYKTTSILGKNKRQNEEIDEYSRPVKAKVIEIGNVDYKIATEIAPKPVGNGKLELPLKLKNENVVLDNYIKSQITSSSSEEKWWEKLIDEPKQQKIEVAIEKRIEEERKQVRDQLPPTQVEYNKAQEASYKRLPSKEEIKKLLEKDTKVNTIKKIVEDVVLKEKLSSGLAVTLVRDNVIKAVEVSSGNSPKVDSLPTGNVYQTRSESSMKKRAEYAERLRKFQLESERAAQKRQEESNRYKRKMEPEEPATTKRYKSKEGAVPPPPRKEGAAVPPPPPPSSPPSQSKLKLNFNSSDDNAVDPQVSAQITNEVYGMLSVIAGPLNPWFFKIGGKINAFGKATVKLIGKAIQGNTMTVEKALEIADRQQQEYVEQAFREKGVVTRTSKSGKRISRKVDTGNPYQTRSKGAPKAGIYGRERMYWEDIPNEHLFNLPDPEKEAKKEVAARKRMKR